MTNPAPANSRHSLPGADDITRVVLPNGIVVLARPNFNSPSVTLNGYLQVGALADPDELLGLADFTASALMRGTHSRTFQQLYNALESVGATFGYGGGTHSTGLGGKALAEDLDLLLDMLAETLRTPLFPADQIERLRAQMLTSLAIRSQDTADMASLTFDQIVYAGHPYARPEEGEPQTIQAIQRQHLLDFHATHYGPCGMAIAIVGAVDPQVAVQKVAAVLGDWHNPRQPAPQPLPGMPPLPESITRKVVIPGKSQADIILGVSGPPRSHPDFMAAALGNSILGQFGMFGRIGKAVREQAGLAYYAYSSVIGGSGPGPWLLSAGVDPANVERAIELMRQELRRFITEPVSAAELDDNQANFIGRLPLSFETNGGVAAALLNQERYNLGLDYYRRYPDLVLGVTPERILATARQYLDPDRLGIAIAGP